MKEGKGYRVVKSLGRDPECVAGVMQLIFGARICVGGADDECGYDEAYDYEDMEVAMLSFSEWDPNIDDEPTGWVRHILSYRRRPAGNPDREYVAQ